MAHEHPPDAAVEARRQLQELADIVARSCPSIDLARSLRALHPKAARAISRRELAAIVELASRPLRSS